MDIMFANDSKSPITSSQIEVFTSPESKLNISGTDTDKSTLQELNDRLAIYVETVRQFGLQAASHPETLKIVETNVSKIIEELKSIYDSELNNSKDVIEILRTEKNNLECQLENIKSEKNKIQEDANFLTAQIELLKSELAKADIDYIEKKGEYEILSKELERTNSEASILKSRLSAIDERNLSRESKLENLMKKCSELESKKSILEEEIKFKTEVHDRELEAALQKVNELQEISTLQESQVVDELNQFRQEFQDDISNAKEDVFVLFKNRLKEAEDELFGLKQELRELEKDYQTAMTDNGNLKIQIEELASKNHVLELKVDQVEKDKNFQLNKYKMDQSNLEKQLEESNAKLHNLIFDYHEALNNHLTFDGEINAFRCLLDSEEKRLGISGRKRSSTSLNYKQYNFVSKIKKRFNLTSFDCQRGYYVGILNNRKKAFTFTDFKLKVGEKIYPIPKFTIPSGMILMIYSTSYDGPIELNSVVLRDLKSFEPTLGFDTSIALLDNKDQVVCDGLATKIQDIFPQIPKEKKRKSSCNIVSSK